MRLKFKVTSMVNRALVTNEKTVEVVLVKLTPVDQVAGDIVVAVENPLVVFRPEEWLKNNDGAQTKKIVSANTVIQETAGEAGGKKVTFVQDGEYFVEFTAAK